MKITNKLGQEIIKRLAENIDVDINIMNLDGKIVASTDKSRINELHSGAIEVIKTNNSLILNNEDVHYYPGTRPGVNLPIVNQQKMSGVVGVSGSPQDIMRITGLIRTSVEIVIDQIYTQQQKYFKERQWNNWLHQLLHPSGYNKEKLLEEATYSLRISTETYWRVIVLQGAGVHHLLEEIRQEITLSKINSLFTLPFKEDEVIIAVSIDFEAIQRLLNWLYHKKVRIGVGDQMYGLDGIRQSYQLAKQALWFNEGKRKITYSQEWNLERLAGSIPDDVFNNICLKYKHLLESLGEVYINTIDTYFLKNFSAKETAETLHIHRNTLLYRLEQITLKVGLDPRLFDDAFLLRTIRSRKEI
ncbi:CdaR family transcriptional regulator [Lentibacillus juripiscarius]|uniref:CdaR family transcriptional regulator n=1 Tax=Lentibacillus juripiscarius TaxID=257446 RepID=A0ABW5V918_9BACI